MIWLILLTFVAGIGGLIGWAGDTIGRKIGRRHVRLFGLRPRASGVLVAILSGVAVALLSVGTVALLARDALNTALEAQDVRAERDQVRGELIKVNAEFSARLADLTRTRAAKQQLAGQLDHARRSLDLSQGQLTGARANLDATTRVNADLVGQRDDLNNKIAQLGLTINAKTKELERAVSDSRQQSTRIAGLNAALAQLSQQRARLAADLTGLQVQRDNISAQRDDLQAQRDSLQAQRDNLQTQGHDLARHVLELSAQTTVLEQRNRALQSQLQTLQTQVSPLQGKLKALNAQARALTSDRAAAEAAKRQAQDDVTGLNLLRSSLRLEIDSLKQRTTDLSAQLSDTSHKLTAAVSTRNQVQLDLARVKASLEIERRGAQSEDLVCRKDEAIVQLSLARGQDSPALKARLLDGLRQANALVEARGAGRSHPTAQDATPIDRAISQAQAGGDANLVVLRCDRNLARGVPANFRFDITPLRVLFRAGTPVRQTELSIGTATNPRSDADIRADLLRLELDLVNDLKVRGLPPEIAPGVMVSYDDMTEFIARLRSTARLEPGRLPTSSVSIALTPKTDVTAAGPNNFYFVTLR